jgi:Tetratricopeptide repeat
VRGVQPIALVLALFASSSALADGDDAFTRGLARFEADDYAGAIAPLVAAHASDPSDPAAALLLGIAYYQTGNDDAALPLLAQAARANDAETRDSANVFLGLAADRGADAGLAHHYYEVVARSSGALGASGRALLDRGSEPRWSLVAVIRPEIDSNVALLPDTSRGATGAADADLLALADAAVRPIDAVPLALEDTLSYRRQERLTAYDMLFNSAGATWTRAGDLRAAAAYHFEASTLGGARFALGHVGDLALRYAPDDGAGVAVRYAIAARDFAPDAYAGYGGIVHTAGADLSWGGPGRGVELAAGYVFQRELTADPALSATAHGARAALRVAIGRGRELRLSALAADRTYDDVTAMGRHDRQLRADAAFYVDLSSTFGVVIGGAALRNASNLADYDATKLTAYAGVVAAVSP